MGHRIWQRRINEEIDRWQSLLQPAVNDGVYRCGFARTQAAYDRAETDLFKALQQVEQALQDGRSWLCGDELSLADVRLFPTLIRWEVVYAPLFGCSRQPLWQFPNLWRWRQRFTLPGVDDTCDAKAWRQDYFGALFPLNPGGIVPAGPDLSTLVHAGIPRPRPRLIRKLRGSTALTRSPKPTAMRCSAIALRC